MSYRTVVVTKRCKLSYKNGYLLVRGDDVHMIHLNEIGTLFIENTSISISSFLLCELINQKIKVIFCDEHHNPKGEVVSCYGSHNTSKKISNQIKWKQEVKDQVWLSIIKQKISNQSALLKKTDLEDGRLQKYYELVEPGDITNREGHAAKVFFNRLFGKDFYRDSEDSDNIALNYGYSILLSSFNKEVSKLGYLTQLGIHHKNEFNHFNLSCDLMEAFRVLVEETVFKFHKRKWDNEFRQDLINLMNQKFLFKGKKYYLSNIISFYTKDMLDAVDNEDLSLIPVFQFV